MTSIRSLEFLLFLLFHHVYSEKPEPVFRIQDNTIEMGYCFGADYIVVYRSSPEGDQLLGNSSADTTPVTPPADLQGRIKINKQEFLLGLQIHGLTPMDSAIYRKECWQNQTLVSQLTQQLFVCNEEIESEEIIVKEEDAGTELLCNSPSMRLEGTSVRWYHEMYPNYKLTLFLDTSVSLEPLVEELQSFVKVKDKGALLVIDNSVLKNNLHLYCFVFKGKNCLTMQNMHLPDRSENRDVFASQDERMVLHCSSEGYNQYWETPFGKFNSSDQMQNEMYITTEDKDFSLVIPKVTDEYTGEYSCISSSREMQYYLVLCPVKTSSPHQKTEFEGRNLLLNCDVDQEDQTVHWYRRLKSKKHITELIHYSSDPMVSIPEDLIDRLTASKKGSSLQISNLMMNDAGEYFCVVLRDLKILENYPVDDYTDTEDTTGGDDLSVDQYWSESERCIFKQGTILIVKDQVPGTSPRANPPAAAHIIGSAVAVIVVLLIVVIVIVIAIKRKRKNSQEQRKSDELDTQKDGSTKKDDPSTKMLTNEC